jgi:hypothetical protein
MARDRPAQRLSGRSMPPRETNDPEHWRNRAAQMRTLASTMPGEAAILMNDLAEEYDRLAERAVIRANGKKPLSPGG